MGLAVLIAKFLASFFDFQTLITIVAGNIVKRPKLIVLWAIISALIGFSVHAYLSAHVDGQDLILRITGQMALAYYIYRTRKKRDCFSKNDGNSPCAVEPIVEGNQ